MIDDTELRDIQVIHVWWAGSGGAVIFVMSSLVELGGTTMKGDREFVEDSSEVPPL